MSISPSTIPLIKPVYSIERQFRINNNNKIALAYGDQRLVKTCSITLLADAS